MERKIVADHMTISYKGLFSIQELYRLLDFWFMEKGYTKHELRAEEQVGPEGRNVYLNKEPYRKISDYLKNVIRCEVYCNNVKEVEIERDGRKIRLNQGECNVIITGYLVSDYEKKWEKNAVFYFIRGVFDKYVWRHHTYKGESGLVDECTHLYAQVKAFLNLYRYQDGV
jgi:hypothetical protein